MPGSFGRDACDLDELRSLVEQAPGTYEYASRVECGIPVYSAADLRAAVAAGSDREVRASLADVLRDGPGVVVLAGAFEPDVVDRATAVFDELIERQRADGIAVGDHYAKPGANDRIWNALEKLAVAAPEVFVDYYANDMLALASLAWLGPGYQVTSQVNVVNPGGDAQLPHRDYHLGFMTDDQAEAYPAHVHLMSPMLTLQGAVAHGAMPVESGPTMLLPHSQKYPLGYLAWRRPEFIEYFDVHRVQVPLEAGDCVFFNPAVMHAAGANRTPGVRRMANLLQVSSAMGRAMETVDRVRMSTAVYGAMSAALAAGRPDALIRNVAVAVADGYAFPTNLDKDPPVGGLTPPSHLDLLLDALRDGVSCDEFAARLEAHVERRRSV